MTFDNIWVRLLQFDELDFYLETYQKNSDIYIDDIAIDQFS